MGLFTDFTFRLWVRSLPNASEQQLISQAAHYSARAMEVGADVHKLVEFMKRLDALRQEMRRRGMTTDE